MKKKLARLSHITIRVILWFLGGIFILAGIGNLGSASATGLCMLALGAILLPATWSFVARKYPHIFNRKLRVASAAVFFMAAALTAPQQPVNTISTTTIEPSNAHISSSSESKDTTDKPESLSKIIYENGTYAISGTGVADQTYFINVSGKDIETSTNHEGYFRQTIPNDIARFSTVKLTRDTNGAWPGGKQTYDEAHLVLNEQSSELTETLQPPLVLGLGGNEHTYEISGYYLPNTTLLLKAGDSTLASVKVDKTGRYNLRSISVDKNYLEVALYEKISTGWSSSRDEKRGEARYIDTSTKKLLKALPITQKEVSTNEPIAFGSRNIESADLNKGQTRITQEGSDGIKTNTYRVTYRGNDEVSRELIQSAITKQPIEKITTVGTYVYVAPTYTAPKTQAQAPQTSSNGRTGAICRDGSSSTATGRGACSHHGGVSQWLY